MKKLIRLFLPVVAVLVLAMSLSGCAVGLTCLSHIDRDSNGKCDNCGFEMPISNVENLTIKTEPTKTYYAFNETIDPAGGVLLVEYKDDTPDEEVPFTDERVTIEAPNMSSAGKKMVRVTFDNASVNYVIEVGSQRFTITLDANYPDARARARDGGQPCRSARRPRARRLELQRLVHGRRMHSELRLRTYHHTERHDPVRRLDPEL